MMMRLMAAALFATTMGLSSAGDEKAQEGKQSVYDFEMKSIDGKPVKLAGYKGRVMLIVNVASK